MLIVVFAKAYFGQFTVILGIQYVMVRFDAGLPPCLRVVVVRNDNEDRLVWDKYSTRSFNHDLLLKDLKLSDHDSHAHRQKIAGYSENCLLMVLMIFLKL